LPLFLFLSLPTSADKFSSLKYLTKVQSIIQDENHFIWLADHKGLIRFDGNNFINYSSSSNEWKIPFTWVHSISQVDNNFLVATEKDGLWIFEPNTGLAKKISIDVYEPNIYDAISFKSNYYLDIPNKFYSYNPKEQTTTLLNSDIKIRKLKKTKKYLYASSQTGLFRLNNNKLIKILDTPISAMTSLDDGLIAFSKDHIYYFNDNAPQISIISKNTIHASARVQGTEDVFTLDRQGNIKKYSSKALKELPHNYSSFPPIYAKELILDTSGVLWATSSQGVKRLSPSFTKDNPMSFNVVNNTIEISSIKNRVVLGTNGDGIHQLSEKDIIFTKEINDKLTNKNKRITDLLHVKDELYIATFEGLWRYSLQDNQLSKVNFTDKKVLLLKLTHKDGLLYIATNNEGVYIYDLQKKQIIEHIYKGLSSVEVIDVLPQIDNTIWLATAAGIDIYDNTTKKTQHINTPAKNKIISLVHYDHKIFASSKGDGILVFNLSGDLLEHLANGVDFTQIQVIKNEVWAPAQHGLYIINPNDYRIKMIPNTEKYTFTDAPILLKNTVYVPHYGGVLEVPLLKQKTFNPKVLISKTTITGQPELLNKTIKVDSSNAVITLELASLDYREGQEKKFKYRINDGVLNEINGNQLTLTGLSPGMYYLEIMGTNSLGQWSDYKAYTEINVAYPWYWTAKMRVFYVIFAIITIIAIIRLVSLRHQSLTKVHKLLSAELKSKGNTAINLNRNLAMASRMIKESKDHYIQIKEVQIHDIQMDYTALEQQQNHCINEVGKLLSSSLDEIQKTTHSQEPDALYGNDLLIGLPFMLKHLHKKHDIFISEKIEITVHTLSFELQADIYKIIYEAFSAAILNSEARHFTLAIRIFKEKFWITLTDDIDSFVNFDSKVSFNMAMYYIRQIVEKHNASMNIFNSSDQGSQLVISIPLMNIN
jgi:AraC family chitin signaling transcriptional activator